MEWCELLELEHVPVLYQGAWELETIKKCFTGKSYYNGEQEGYVARNPATFDIQDFKINCVKYVRAKHVQTSDFWMNQPIEPNELKS